MAPVAASRGPFNCPTEQNRRVTSFSELFASVQARRESGDLAGALALFEGRERDFPLQKGLVFLIRAELLGELRQPDRAIESLDAALLSGCRYKRSWLDENPRLAALRNLPGFRDVTERSARRYEEDSAAARPELTVLMPEGPTPRAGYPLLVALHGNNSTMADTVGYWSSPTRAGWVIAVPQSSEIGVSPGAFTWNETDRTVREVTAHIGEIAKRTRLDPDRLMMGGFSMGGLQAMALPLTGRVRARAFVAVAAWLPRIGEFATMLDRGPGRELSGYVVVGTRDPNSDGAKQLVALLVKHRVRAHLDLREELGHEYPADMPETLDRALSFASI
jgi:pimeloyl-ACP methyl ester carboxylesterase